MIPQSTFMIIATIAEDRESELRALLATMNSAPGYAAADNHLLPYAQFHQLHVARFVIIKAHTNDDIKAHGVAPTDWSPKLAFLGDIDGDRDLFLAELVIRASDGLRKIFSHCDGFDTHHENLLEWLHRHSQNSKANYVNWIGRTVTQIKEEYALSITLNTKLNELARTHGFGQATLVHKELRKFVAREKASLRLRLSPAQPTPAGWWFRNLCHLITLPLVVVLFSPILLVSAPFYFIFLRNLEVSDPQNTQRPDADHLHSLMDQEDIDVTNHFNVFGQVKPGLFRAYTVRALLYLLDYASRHIYRFGFLTRVQSIHFARWVLLDNSKRIYFASNYDGSADSYMDDFINKVAWGLNLVFSNGVGYPHTRWLIKEGAEHESNYKKTLRRNQFRSESWYKAYPGLTAIDLAHNSRIRKGLERQHLTEKQAAKWLSLLKVNRISPFLNSHKKGSKS